MHAYLFISCIAEQIEGRINEAVICAPPLKSQQGQIAIGNGKSLGWVLLCRHCQLSAGLWDGGCRHFRMSVALWPLLLSPPGAGCAVAAAAVTARCRLRFGRCCCHHLVQVALWPLTDWQPES